MMKRAVRHVGDEIQRIRSMIDAVQTHVELLERPHQAGPHMMRINERLKEAQARLEGLEQFVEECGNRRVRGTPSDEEEIDVWL